ncbi:MAG: terminase family protein [Candidatus Binatus sp.]|uniref:terminase large subunit domain-containing protein n=1 Tax=Candidatus Binatus sp. TaxID=2811406 RepID=UPI003C778091
MQIYSDLAMALDPALLFARVIGAEPDEFQREILTGTDPRVLACCGRGTGKSAATAIAAAHQALYAPGSLTIVGSPSLNVSQELGRKIFQAIKTVDAETVQENLSRIELRNGSRVIVLPASEKTRGLHGCELLIIDEGQLVEPEMFSVLEPFQSTAKNPRKIVLGTPKAKIGKFWEYFSNGQYKVLKVRSTECSRISKEFLEAQLAALGPHEFAQEYEAEFQDPTSAVFSSSLIDAATRDYQVWNV